MYLQIEYLRSLRFDRMVQPHLHSNLQCPKSKQGVTTLAIGRGSSTSWKTPGSSVHGFSTPPWTTGPLVNGPQPTRRTTPFPGYRLPAPPWSTGGTHYGQTVPAPSTPTDTSLRMTTTHRRSNMSKASLQLFFHGSYHKSPSMPSYTYRHEDHFKQRLEMGKLLLGNPETAHDVLHRRSHQSILGNRESGPSGQRQKYSYRQQKTTSQHKISHFNTLCFTWRQCHDLCTEPACSRLHTQDSCTLSATTPLT